MTESDTNDTLREQLKAWQWEILETAFTPHNTTRGHVDDARHYGMYGATEPAALNSFQTVCERCGKGILTQAKSQQEASDIFWSLGWRLNADHKMICSKCIAKAGAI